MHHKVTSVSQKKEKLSQKWPYSARAGFFFFFLPPSPFLPYGKTRYLACKKGRKTYKSPPPLFPFLSFSAAGMATSISYSACSKHERPGGKAVKVFSGFSVSRIKKLHCAMPSNKCTKKVKEIDLFVAVQWSKLGFCCTILTGAVYSSPEPFFRKFSTFLRRESERCMMVNYEGWEKREKRPRPRNCPFHFANNGRGNFGLELPPPLCICLLFYFTKELPSENVTFYVVFMHLAPSPYPHPTSPPSRGGNRTGDHDEENPSNEKKAKHSPTFEMEQIKCLKANRAQA